VCRLSLPRSLVEATTAIVWNTPASGSAEHETVIARRAIDSAKSKDSASIRS
jgi:hypothetical protein